MFILLIDVDDDTQFVVFNDLSLHDIAICLHIESAPLKGLFPTSSREGRVDAVLIEVYCSHFLPCCLCYLLILGVGLSNVMT
jgi:hypothetical protein